MIKNEIQKAVSRLTLENAERFFQSIKRDEVRRHKRLWKTIIPKNDDEVFQRYLFAFMSVHTSWESNVKGYEALKDFRQWLGSDEELLARITFARVGMQNNRTKFISAFAKDFWNDPKIYQKSVEEDWVVCRDRIQKRINGLGYAKSSFSLEMIYPMSAEIVCMDVHLFRLYGLDQNKDMRDYKKIESHWVGWAKLLKIPSYICRAIYWNRQQNQKDCSYWSYVFLK